MQLGLEQHLAQIAVKGFFRDLTDGDSGMAPVVHGRQFGRTSFPDPRDEAHGHPLVLPVEIILFRRAENDLLALVLLRSDAEHVRSLLTGIVAVGEALTGEGGFQQAHVFFRRQSVFLCGPRVDAGDDGGILGTAHAAFQLQAGDAHPVQIVQIADEAVVLQTERILAGMSAGVVALTAGLGAQTAVAAATANHGAHVTLSGIAHAQSAVSEDLNLDGGVRADVGDLVPVELPRETDALQAHRGAHLHALQAVNAHLRAAVKLKTRQGTPQDLDHAEILNDQGVGSVRRGLFCGLQRGRYLTVGQERIQRDEYLDAADAAVFGGAGELVLCEVFGVAAGVEIAEAQIDSVGSVLNGGDDRFRAPRGGQDLKHKAYLRKVRSAKDILRHDNVPIFYHTAIPEKREKGAQK